MVVYLIMLLIDITQTDYIFISLMNLFLHYYYFNKKSFFCNNITKYNIYMYNIINILIYHLNPLHASSLIVLSLYLIIHNDKNLYTQNLFTPWI